MPAPPPTPADAEEQRRRLRTALALVEQMAGEPAAPPPTPDQGAARSAPPPIALRRFDALATEAGAFAAAGIAALIRYQDDTGQACAPAAAQLARDMRRALAEMERLIPTA